MGGWDYLRRTKKVLIHLPRFLGKVRWLFI